MRILPAAMTLPSSEFGSMEAAASDGAADSGEAAADSAGVEAAGLAGAGLAPPLEQAATTTATTPSRDRRPRRDMAPPSGSASGTQAGPRHYAQAARRRRGAGVWRTSRLRARSPFPLARTRPGRLSRAPPSARRRRSGEAQRPPG